MKPVKGEGPGDEPAIIRRWEGGLTWMAHPNELLQRASHALVVDADVWLVDPVDAEGLDDELAARGSVSGVVVLSSEHVRHADRLANRHHVSVHVPTWFDDPASAFDAPVETFEDELDETGFELVWLTDRFWQEGALYHSERKTLVVEDMLATALFTARGERLGVVPFFRFSPPREQLGDLLVERILVGHGAGIFVNAQSALEEALTVSLPRTVSSIARSVPVFVRSTLADRRS